MDEDMVFDDLLDGPEGEVVIDPADIKEDIFGNEDVVPQTDGVLGDFLKSFGINDGMISVVDEESGEESAVSFSTLSREEQLEILGQLAAPKEAVPSEYTYNEEEQELLSVLRENNLTLQDYLERYRDEILAQAGGDGQNYTVDMYSDEELYLLDQQRKFDLSQEELEAELESALKNKELFDKKVASLRKEYQEIEDEQRRSQEEEFSQQQQQQYQEFSETMVKTAIDTPDMYGIDLEDEEKEEVLSYILDLDDNGTSEFYRSLNDPNKLYQAAWFLRYGKDAFDLLKESYEAEISRLKKDTKPKVTLRTPNKGDNGSDIYKTIDDIF